MEGWISIHRQILEHWVWKNSDYLKAWLAIILTVNHEEKKVLIHGEIINCERGQSLKSLDNWAKLFGKNWTIQKVRTFFKLLETDSMISIEGLRKTTRLTVCNYDSYQDLQQTNNTQLTDKQHTDNTQITTNNNDNNDNNDNNINREYIDFEKIKKIFNEKCEYLQKISIINDTRKKTISARIKETAPEDVYLFFEDFFKKINDSDFLNGNNDKNWKASFDWVINKSNFLKIIEGNYDNRDTKSTRTKNGNSQGQWQRNGSVGVQGKTSKQPYFFTGADVSNTVQTGQSIEGDYPW